VREAAAEVAQGVGLPRRQVYRLALDVSGEDVAPRAAERDANE
jgi:hypothetical protein